MRDRRNYCELSKAHIGIDTVIEPGVACTGPDNIYIGDNCYIGKDVVLEAHYGNSIIIGSDTWIGCGVYMNAYEQISFGEGVGIGPGVKVITSQHYPYYLQQYIVKNPLQSTPIRIGHGSDIGCNAVVMNDVGDYTIIGAGAVVAKPAISFSVYRGVPAKQTRSVIHGYH